MADEKVMLGRNELNRINQQFRKQLDKRLDAGAPAPATARVHLDKINKAAVDDGWGMDDLISYWDAYYPTIVSLLGWASWVIPGPTVNIIKALLATVNNSIIPILRKAAQSPA